MGMTTTSYGLVDHVTQPHSAHKNCGNQLLERRKKPCAYTKAWPTIKAGETSAEYFLLGDYASSRRTELKRGVEAQTSLPPEEDHHDPVAV